MFKLWLRNLTNTTVRLFPSAGVRYVLKSYFYQPQLQDRIQYHVQPYRFDSPIPHKYELEVEKLKLKRPLPGFPADLSCFRGLLQKFGPYAAEISSFPVEKDAKSEFWFHNGAYEDFDAVTLYSMLRHLKPKKMIEVGCGFSSRMTTLAARKNRSEGFPMDCQFIEPFPPPYLLDFELSGPLLKNKVQAAALADFAALQSGDVLFIDTSHVLKTQNDLCHILTGILPSLASGVYVHFHDIFTPYEYPEEWLLKINFFFNEQYALEAILCNSSAYEIILPVYALSRDHPEWLKPLLPAGERRPAAFWLRKN